MHRFSDNVIIITGAGSGLGRASALRLAREGARLALVDISEEGLRETEAEIAAAVPETSLLAITADVSDENDVSRYVEATLNRFARIDGFFNNAGVEGTPGLTENYTAREFDRVVAINLRGVFLGLEKVLPVMREQGGGAVVNSASVGGIRGVGNQSGYAAAKHGVVGLTRNSAVEYAPFGVRVNAIAPGAIWTPMIEKVMRKVNPDDPAAAAARYIDSNPMRRLGTADEIASVVAFLLSTDAGYVNAAVLPIDGGQSAEY